MKWCNLVSFARQGSPIESRRNYSGVEGRVFSVVIRLIKASVRKIQLPVVPRRRKNPDSRSKNKTGAPAHDRSQVVLFGARLR